MKDRMNETAQKMQRAKRDAVPSCLNRWQYGCIKKAAGVSTMLFTQSALNPWTGWLDSNEVFLDFLLFLFFCVWQSQNVHINKPQIPPVKCSNMDEGK